MYQYRQIIVRVRLGETDRSIAKSGLAGRQKVKEIRKLADSQGWLEPSVSLPGDEVLLDFFAGHRKPTVSTVSSILPYQDQVTQWHSEGIQISTIHNALVRNHGFTGSYDAVRRFVRKLKSCSPDVTIPLDFKPGECAQVDFGSGPKLLQGKTNTLVSTWIFVMVLAWSRHTYAEVVYNQRVETWLACHRHAFEWFNGVVSKVTIDNPKCAITKACYYDPIVQRAYEEFAQGYEFIISPCPPREPKKKGRVESGVKYVKRNFVPLREFRDIVDANQQLRHWLLETAGNRIHGSTHQKPLSRFAIESGFLKALPDNPPDLAVWSKVKVHGVIHHPKAPTDHHLMGPPF